MYNLTSCARKHRRAFSLPVTSRLERNLGSHIQAAHRRRNNKGPGLHHRLRDAQRGEQHGSMIAPHLRGGDALEGTVTGRCRRLLFFYGLV
jgi:hypothetical protein